MTKQTNKENSIKIRKELYQRIENEGLESLYLELLKVDKESAEIIDRYNSRRVIRALEVFYKDSNPSFSILL